MLKKKYNAAVDEMNSLPKNSMQVRAYKARQ